MDKFVFLDDKSYSNPVIPLKAPSNKIPPTHKLPPTINEEQECENTPKNEDDFEKSLSSIIRYYEKQYGFTLISNEILNNTDGKVLSLMDIGFIKHGQFCILNEKDCLFDNRDTYYSWTGIDYTLNDNDFYLIVGLNHNNFSLSTMNSISIANVINSDNGNQFEIIDTVTNEQYETYDFGLIYECDSNLQSRRPRKAALDHCSKFNDVFTVQISRPSNCIDIDINIPSICLSTDVLSEDDRFIFFGEATLNPITKTMPDQDCLIEWRLLTFTI